MHTHEEALGGSGSCSRTAPVCESHALNADVGGWSLYVLHLARTSQVCIYTSAVEGTTRASPTSSSHSHSHTHMSHCVTLSGETLLNLDDVGKAAQKPSIVLKRWTEWKEVAFSQATGDQSAAVLVHIRTTCWCTDAHGGRTCSAVLSLPALSAVVQPVQYHV